MNNDHPTACKMENLVTINFSPSSHAFPSDNSAPVQYTNLVVFYKLGIQVNIIVFYKMRWSKKDKQTRGKVVKNLQKIKSRLTDSTMCINV